MTTTEAKRLGGFALLVICSIVILAGGFTDAVPAIAGAPAVLGLAAGTLLVGTSGDGRPA